MKILITGACGVTSRSVTRGLRRDSKVKLTIVGCGIFENKYALYEGIYDKTIVVPKCTSPDYHTVLKKLLKTEKFDAALVIPESEVAIWAKKKFNVPYLIPNLKFITNVSNKKKLNNLLKDTVNVPMSIFLDRESLQKGIRDWRQYPCWIRPISFLTSSGFGSMKCHTEKQVVDFIEEYSSKSEWQISKFIDGRNIAVSLLYKNSKLVKHAMYERLEYFQGHLIKNGISGNIARGKIFEDNYLLEQIVGAMDFLSARLGVHIDGFLTVDLLLGLDNIAKITEVNVRPTAPVEAYSLAGISIVNAWLEQTLNKQSIGSTSKYKIPSYIYRDIDGKLILADS
jgi:predicted ATP-grasp superfamily ATP-dependent carboligase